MRVCGIERKHVMCCGCIHWLTEHTPPDQQLVTGEVTSSLPSQALQAAGARTPDRLAAAKKAMAFVAALQQELERRSYVSRVAQFLGIGEDVVLGSVRTEDSKRGSVSPPRASIKNSLERILASLYVRFPREFEGAVPEEIFSRFEDQEIGKIVSLCRRHFQETGRTDWGSLGEWQAVLEDPLLRDLLFAGDEVGEERARQTILDTVERWRKDRVQRELKRLTGAITAAEMAQDDEAVKRLLSEKKEAVRRIAGA